jgi:4-hydroxybutyryl-CoA dehydratase/vinylacetyl-CoA-Delta-isomerase
MHQTGAVNSHWLIFMPTMRMTEKDRDWSVVGAVRVDAPASHISSGARPTILAGSTARDGCRQRAIRGQESLIVFENVFVPHAHVFMDGEWEYATRWSSVSLPITVRLMSAKRDLAMC